MKLEHISLHWNAGSGDYTISLDLGVMSKPKEIGEHCLKEMGNQHSLCDFPQHASLIEIADILSKWSTKIRQLAIVEELV